MKSQEDWSMYSQVTNHFLFDDKTWKLPSKLAASIYCSMKAKKLHYLVLNVERFKIVLYKFEFVLINSMGGVR